VGSNNYCYYNGSGNNIRSDYKINDLAGRWNTHGIACAGYRLSWLAYVIVRRVSKSAAFTGNSNKILSLSGFSSGLMLLIFAVVILVEAIKRFFNPLEIQFKEAIMVALIGLAVNIASAFLLRHDHEHSDHNIRAAYLHVIADALTSVTAIIGLTGAMLWNIVWLDALGAIIVSFVIIRWSVGLLKGSGKVLLDIQSSNNGHHH